VPSACPDVAVNTSQGRTRRRPQPNASVLGLWQDRACLPRPPRNSLAHWSPAEHWGSATDTARKYSNTSTRTQPDWTWPNLLTSCRASS